MGYNNNPPKQSFTASALQTDFVINFKLFETSDVVVYQTPSGNSPDDVADLLIEITDYTVVIDGDNGATISLVVGAGVNDTIVIKRAIPINRATDYQQGGDILAKTTNDDQNLQTYLVADLQEATNSSIRLPDSAVGVEAKLPDVIGDAYIKWNSAGTGLENDTAIPDNVISSEDSNLESQSWANENEDVPVKEFTAGIPSDIIPTSYSSKNYAAKASLQADIAKGYADTIVANSEWVTTGLVDTYVSATTFTVPGDQTDIFAISKRIKANLSGGAVYSHITNAVFTTLTTVTIADAVLDATLTSVQPSLINPINNNGSVNAVMVGAASEEYVDGKTDIQGLPEKLTLEDSDKFTIADSDDSFALKKITWGTTFKTTILAYIDTLFSRTLSIFGIGQTWQDVLASRSSGVVYTNTTGRPILISISGATNLTYIKVDGIIVHRFYSASASTGSVVVPNNSTYEKTGNQPAIWAELR